METKQLKYTLTFLSDWHAGSGLSSGSDADAIVMKDPQNLPFLPGKTIKGLIKDALLDIVDLQNRIVPQSIVDKLMGAEIIENEKVTTQAGTLFFSNAAICEDTAIEISEEMSYHLYRKIASTSIDDNGIAIKGSLRTIEVCLPLKLEGYIDGIESSEVEYLTYAFKLIRHIGVNRNRGLGRCKFEIL